MADSKPAALPPQGSADPVIRISLQSPDQLFNSIVPTPVRNRISRAPGLTLARPYQCRHWGCVPRHYRACWRSYLTITWTESYECHYPGGPAVTRMGINLEANRDLSLRLVAADR